MAENASEPNSYLVYDPAESERSETEVRISEVVKLCNCRRNRCAKSQNRAIVNNFAASGSWRNDCHEPPRCRGIAEKLLEDLLRSIAQRRRQDTTVSRYCAERLLQRAPQLGAALPRHCSIIARRLASQHSAAATTSRNSIQILWGAAFAWQKMRPNQILT